jgi:hypothetical protein
MPGDILMLGAGSYPAFTVSKNGAAGQQIVIRGESVDTVIIGGRVTMNDRQYVNLENVTVMGEVRMNGASNMVVRGCRIRTTAGGIRSAARPGSTASCPRTATTAARGFSSPGRGT